MSALFVAIKPPEFIAERLTFLQGGIPGARWEPAEKLHITLRYIGEADGGLRRRVIDALQQVHPVSAFEVTLAGVGTFPPRQTPRSLWVGVEDPRPLTELHRRVDLVLATIEGLSPDPRKFTPHLTLARLTQPPEAKVAEFLSAHALLQCPPFPVERVLLMSSVRSRNGSSYRVEAGY